VATVLAVRRRAQHHGCSPAQRVGGGEWVGSRWNPSVARGHDNKHMERWRQQDSSVARDKFCGEKSTVRCAQHICKPELLLQRATELHVLLFSNELWSSPSAVQCLVASSHGVVCFSMTAHARKLPSNESPPLWTATACSSEKIYTKKASPMLARTASTGNRLKDCCNAVCNPIVMSACQLPQLCG
jgi:hypothetical protein